MNHYSASTMHVLDTAVPSPLGYLARCPELQHLEGARASLKIRSRLIQLHHEYEELDRTNAKSRLSSVVLM